MSIATIEVLQASRTGDVDRIRLLASKCAIEDKPVEYFFQDALKPYYNSPRKLDISAAQLIYWFSEMVPKEELNMIAVYPDDDKGKLQRYDGRWISLDQWRKDWEQQSKHPEYNERIL